MLKTLTAVYPILLCVLTLSAFIKPSSAHANLMCKDLFTQSTALPQVFLLLDDDVKISKNEVLRVAYSMFNVVGFNQDHKISIKLDSKLSHFESTYDPVGNAIHLGVSKERTLSVQEKAILGHEFGHYLFNRSFKVMFRGKEQNLYQAMINLSRQIRSIEQSQEYIVISKEIDEFSKEAQTAQKNENMKLYNFYQPMVLDKIKERSEKFPLEQLKQEQIFLEDVQNLKRSYDELYADLFSVLYHNDGKIVADSLEFAKSFPYLGVHDKAGSTPHYRQQNQLGARPRDFTEVNQFKHWRKEDAYKGKTNFYTQFDPVRGALWKLLEKHQIPSSQNSKILSSFIAAANKHIKLRLQRNEDLYNEQNYTLLNQELLRLIVTELQAENLISKN